MCGKQLFCKTAQFLLVVLVVQILDATFDDIVPLALTQMPRSWGEWSPLPPSVLSSVSALCCQHRDSCLVCVLVENMNEQKLKLKQKAGNSSVAGDFGRNTVEWCARLLFHRGHWYAI